MRIWPVLVLGCLVFMAGEAAGQGKKRPMPPTKSKLSPKLAPSKVRARAPSRKPKLSGPPPVITCAQPEYDFGSAVQGESVTHIFSLKNKGKGVLNIERARGG
jgi:hypothetical protein